MTATPTDHIRNFSIIFMPGERAAQFGGGDAALRIDNPIAADLDQMRPTPVATLALAAVRNAARGFADVALFEIGPAFTGSAPERQAKVAASLRAGRTPRHWREPSRAADWAGARGDALAVLQALGAAARRPTCRRSSRCAGISPSSWQTA